MISLPADPVSVLLHCLRFLLDSFCNKVLAAGWEWLNLARQKKKTYTMNRSSAASSNCLTNRQRSTGKEDACIFLSILPECSVLPAYISVNQLVDINPVDWIKTSARYSIDHFLVPEKVTSVCATAIGRLVPLSEA